LANEKKVKSIHLFESEANMKNGRHKNRLQQK